MLIYRIFTAVILIPLVLAGLFWLPLPYFALLSALIFGMAGWEWAGLTGFNQLLQRYLFSLVLVTTFIISLRLPSLIILISGILIWIILLYFLINYKKFCIIWPKLHYGKAGLGILLLTTAWYSLNLIRQLPTGEYYILFLLLFVWGADIGAYFTGRYLGKHKLAPQISPGKTIEGFIGGLLMSAIISLVAYACLNSHQHPHWVAESVAFLILAIVTASVSVLGDLFESMIKRQAGVKDSGHLLPGHGGVLDRIDSLICAAPIFTVALLLISRFLP